MKDLVYPACSLWSKDEAALGRGVWPKGSVAAWETREQKQSEYIAFLTTHLEYFIQLRDAPVMQGNNHLESIGDRKGNYVYGYVEITYAKAFYKLHCVTQKQILSMIIII